MPCSSIGSSATSLEALPPLPSLDSRFALTGLHRSHAPPVYAYRFHLSCCGASLPGLLSLSCTEAGPHVPRGWPARARVPVAAPNLLALFLLLATTHSRHGDTAMNRAKG